MVVPRTRTVATKNVFDAHIFKTDSLISRPVQTSELNITELYCFIKQLFKYTGVDWLKAQKTRVSI